MENGHLRILLVEQETAERDSIQRYVSQHGLDYQIDTATSVPEASEKLRGRIYDVALMDYQLGDGPSFEVLDEVGDVPGVIVTARGNEKIAAEALRRGAYDYLVKDQEGAYLESLSSTISNVVARKKAERALLDSEARYQDLYDNAPDMYFQLDPDGNILSVNRQGALQLGYTTDELVGQPLSTVVYPDDLPMVTSQLAKIREAPNRLHHIQFRMVTKEGRAMEVSESMTLYHDPDHAPVLRILCRDITAQKEAERRSAQLHERLARSQRMESLGILAGGVAHDLNNILGPLVAYPDLLLHRFEEGSEEYKILADIKHSAKSATTVIRDLLTLARRGRYKKERLDLNEVVRASLESPVFQDLQLGKPDVEIILELGEGLAPIIGTESNLFKVIMNLVINAFEAIEGKGRVVVETYAQSFRNMTLGFESIPADDYVVLKVSDTGEGISEENLGRIFDPFFTTKKLGRSGSGLGLSVVYGVVKDHEGALDVQSRVGEGTAMLLFFPDASTHRATDTVPTPLEITGHERILVVDDLPVQRAIATALLRSLGYSVVSVGSGREAVDFLKEYQREHSNRATKPCDLVLLDMVMEEGFDGLDTYREISGMYPGMRCVIASGFAENDRVKEAQALGAGAYLPKPYTREQLGHTIRAELDR